MIYDFAKRQKFRLRWRKRRKMRIKGILNYMPRYRDFHALQSIIIFQKGVETFQFKIIFMQPKKSP